MRERAGSPNLGLPRPSVGRVTLVGLGTTFVEKGKRMRKFKVHFGAFAVVAALMLVNEAQGVSDFVEEGAAVPTRGTDVKLLHPADHAHCGIAAAESGHVVDHDIIRLRGALRKR